MNKKNITKLANNQNLHSRKTCQNKGEPAQAVDGGLPPASGDPSGQERTDSAKDQPVKKNQGNDDFIALELRKKFAHKDQLTGH